MSLVLILCLLHRFCVPTLWLAAVTSSCRARVWLKWQCRTKESGEKATRWTVDSEPTVARGASSAPTCITPFGTTTGSWSGLSASRTQTMWGSSWTLRRGLWRFTPCCLTNWASSTASALPSLSLCSLGSGSGCCRLVPLSQSSPNNNLKCYWFFFLFIFQYD